MRFNVHALSPGKMVLLEFAELNKYENVFNSDDIGDLDNDLVMRWICFMYDRNGPAEQITDLRVRKAWAAAMAGFGEESLPQKVQEMMNGMNPGVNRRCVLFWKIIGPEQYSTYMYLLEKKWKLMTSEVSSVVTTEQQLKLQEEIIKLQSENLKRIDSQLIELRKEITHHDKAVLLIDEFEQFTLEESQGLQPETWVRRFVEDKKVFPEIKDKI